MKRSHPVNILIFITLEGQLNLPAISVLRIIYLQPIYDKKPSLYLFSGLALEEKPILMADMTSDEALMDMCKAAKVLLNCVGPVSLQNTNTSISERQIPKKLF